MMTLRVWSRLRNIMITGTFVLTPLIITVWILYQFARRLDNFFQPILTPLLDMHIPGLGIIMAIVLVLISGLVAKNYIGKKVQKEFEDLIMRVPVVRGIYSTVQKIIEAIRRDTGREFKRVVMVPYPRQGMYALAFLTGIAPSPDENANLKNNRWFYVFIPHTPNPTTGHVIIVPEDDILNVDMAPNELFQLLISAGLTERVPTPRNHAFRAKNSTVNPSDPPGRPYEPVGGK